MSDQKRYPPLEPLGHWTVNERGKKVFVRYHMGAGEELHVRIENAKADTLTLCVNHLIQTGHTEAAAELGKLWDQPPPATPETI